MLVYRQLAHLLNKYIDIWFQRTIFLPSILHFFKKKQRSSYNGNCHYDFFPPSADVDQGRVRMPRQKTGEGSGSVLLERKNLKYFRFFCWKFLLCCRQRLPRRGPPPSRLLLRLSSGGKNPRKKSLSRYRVWTLKNNYYNPSFQNRCSPMNIYNCARQIYQRLVVVQNVPIQKSPRFFGKAIQICISRYDNKRQAMHKNEKHDDY